MALSTANVQVVGTFLYILLGRVPDENYPQAFADWPKNSQSEDPSGKGMRMPVEGNRVLGP